MMFNRAPKLSLLALGLLAALSVSAPNAVAAGNEQAKPSAKALTPASAHSENTKATTQKGACVFQQGDTSNPYRTDSLPVTLQVEAIFKAASSVDEASFTALLAQTPDINRYLLDDNTLLAVLLRPNLPKAQAGEQDPDNDNGNMSDSTRERMLAAHQALLPARTRMLALLLKAGARPAEFTRSSGLPALHLALLFGTPKMVDLLLQACADPSQPDYLDKESPIEYALQSAFAIRRSGMPDLVSRSDRSAMFLALLKAGARRPYASRDAARQKSEGKRAQSALDKAKTPQAKAKSLSDLDKVQHLVAADFSLWAPLVEMTQGTAVLDAFVRMGTSPLAVDGTENLFSRAAFAGNADAVAWLQKRLPRYYEKAASENHGEADMVQAKPPQRDAWGEAAAWALESPFTAQRLAVLKLLTRDDTNWASSASERIEKTYLARLNAQNPTSSFGSSLLARTVATGDAALLDTALSLNAVRSSNAAFEAQKSRRNPDAEAASASGDALVQALLMQRADLLQRLLTAGASPLAWATGQTTPLAVAANRKAADRYGDRKPLSAQDRTFYAATLDSFLKQLTPAQIRAGDTAEQTPLKDAIDSSDNKQDLVLVNKLIAAGFSPGKLPLSYLEKAIFNGHNVLAQAMLDAGIANPPVTVQTKTEKSIHKENYEDQFSYAIMRAAERDQREMLDRLLALRTPSPTFSTAELRVMIRLTEWGRLDAIKLLQSRGWVVDRTLNQPAINSMQPAVIDFVLKTTHSTLAGLCISGESKFSLHPLVGAIYRLDDAAWQQLLALGVARLPDCAAEPFEERLASGREAVQKTPAPLAMTTLAERLLSDPFAVSGFRKERLPARIAQLRQNGMQKADFGDKGAGPLLRQSTGEAALRPVLAALGASIPTKAPAGAAASRPARLVGSYRLDANRGADVNLQLKADGRFEASTIDGASEGHAEGHWHQADGKVVFAADPIMPFNWFKVTTQTQYADGPDTGQPLTLLVDVGKNRVSESIQTVVQASADDLRWLRVKPNGESTFTLKGQPRIAALWFPQMKTVLASEVTLPDLPRLKSVTLTLQLLPQAPATAFYEVMQADADGLYLDGSLYKKLK